MATKTTSAMLYLDGVNVAFDGFKAINDLSLVIEPGEMRAIIGPNGAGKTTMMDIVTGKTRPDSGDVFFQSGTYDLTTLDETQIAGLGIGRKFQKPTRVRNAYGRGQSAARGQGRPARPCRARLAPERAAVTADRQHPRTIRLKPLRDRQAGSLSHGQKQWLEIACCWRRSRNCCWSTNRWPA